MKKKPDPHETAEETLPRLAGAEPAAEKPQPLLADSEEGEGDDAAENDTPEDENGARQEYSYEMTGPGWKGYVFAALPVFACLFGAGREAWSKGVITILLSVVMILFAPRRRLPAVPLAGMLCALVAPLLAFLPMGWFQIPAWRSSLVLDWGVRLSQTLTPQAGVTLEAWFLFAVCCLWLWWCLTRGFSEVQRRAMIQTLTFGGILLCLLSVLEGSKWIEIPWWPRNTKEWGIAFGPFANRNHISSIAAITCVLCATTAHDAHRRKSRLWVPALLGLFPPLICLYMNSSRAGLILLFFGLTAWIGTIAMRRGFFQKMAVSTSLVFIIATLLVMSGGNVSKRLSENGIAEFASDNGRGSLFLESLKMTLDSPWTGIGLGNFEPVFPQYSGMADNMRRFLHPESDLLWLLAEGGLLTVIPALLVLFWIFTSTGPWSGKKRKSGMADRRLRNAAAIVFGLGVVHGLGDVPNHGLGYALFMAVLAGIAVRPRRLPQAAGLLQRSAFRLIGVVLLGLGVAWAAIGLGHPALPGKSAAEALRARAGILADSGSPAGALPLMDRAIELAPMDLRYYYERACLRLRLGQPKEEALLDFSRSRMLDPRYALLCFSEGVYWLDYDPQFAIVSWREYLRRTPDSASKEYGSYAQILLRSMPYPELREPIWKLATTLEMKFAFLRTVQTREEFGRCLHSLLTQQPDLKGLESVQLENLFNLWYQWGDQASLIAALESKPRWRDSGWRILADYYARNSDFQRACQTALPYLPSLVRTAPGTSTDIPALERALLYNPTDARRAIDLFQAQKTKGDLDGALRTLEKAATFPNAPSYIRQEMAGLYMMKQDYRRAWEQLREAMQKR